MNDTISIISGLCLIGGGFFCVTGALGLLRLKDLFSRTHGAGVIDGLGMFLVVLGLLLQVEESPPAVRLVLIAVFILLSGPTAVHSLARAALESGVPYGPDTEVRTKANASGAPDWGGGPSKP